MQPAFSPPPPKGFVPTLTLTPHRPTRIPSLRPVARPVPRVVAPCITTVSPCIQPANIALFRATVVYADYLGDLCVFDLIHDIRLLHDCAQPAALALTVCGVLLGTQLASVLTFIVCRVDTVLARLSSELRASRQGCVQHIRQHDLAKVVRIVQGTDSPLSPPDVFVRLHQSCFVAMIPLTMLSCWSASVSGLEAIFMESLCISSLSLFALSPLVRRAACTSRLKQLHKMAVRFFSAGHVLR
ncbi:unnamed protein product [Agarophyton chilense]|eukprot:gb/GEZJ01006594.1/.p1 GENE.gb/GEZJ01006594.1/~~gb/GEZJ01006594.1/.p1  ORF type:complete len:260 (-),score=28.86 gb/GEZJ01006594.1/:1436-2161(-)